MKELQRQLGLVYAIAISVSTMLGSGIFVLPGLAAAKTGSSVFLAYIVAGICVVPAALSKAELAVSMPESGGTYVYLDRTFGPLVGTVSGIGLWVSLLLKGAFALIGFTAYLIVIVDLPVKSTALISLVLITLLNIRGVMRVSQVQLAVVAVAVVGLFGLVISGSFSYDPGRLAVLFTDGSGGFFAAVAFVFVSYVGVTQIAAVAEEVKNPTRNLPLGILLSLALVTVIYGVVNLVLVTNVPLETLVTDRHPIYTLAVTLGGEIVGYCFAVLGILTMVSMANSGLLSASRFPFAMSRDNLLPASLHRLHSRYLTPTLSIFLSAAMMAVVILLFDIEKIAKLASAFVIMLYMAECLSVIVLRESGVNWYKPKFRAPMYPWLQVFGIVSGLGLLAVMGTLAIMAGLAIALPGALLFFAYGRSRIDRRGVISQRGRRRELLRTSTEKMSQEDAASEAAGVVMLFGSERSPELLVELGAALTDGEKLDVALINELPEQTALDAVVDERKSQSILRRVQVVAEIGKIPLVFETIASRDIVNTAHQLSNRPRCKWLVTEWAGRSRESYTFRNPLGWLKSHLSCNLATFHDAGVRYIRRIVAVVEPGPHDALVVWTAEHLARVHGADVTFARFLPDDQPLTKVQSVADYLDQIHVLSDEPSKVLLIRGKDEAEAVGDVSIDYDLLVTAEGPQPTLIDMIRGAGRDRMTAKAACSVLRLQTPRVRTHEALGQQPGGDEAGNFKPSALLQAGCINVRIESTKKEELFTRFAETFAEVIPELESTEIVDALWAREQAQNTSVGMGVALPHATIANAKKSTLGVFTTATPADYDAPDEHPVDVFFVTLGPPKERNMHLRLLAAISGLVLKTALLGQLRRAKTAEEVIKAIKVCEESVT